MPEKPDRDQLNLNRRRFVGYLSAVGLGSTLMPGALTAIAQDAATLTPEMVAASAELSGMSFAPEEIQRITDDLNGRSGFIRSFENIREMHLPNSVQPAIVFNPVPPGMELPKGSLPFRRSESEVTIPATDEELAFLPVSQLSRLIERGDLKSIDLTRLYLERLRTYDPTLHCVVTMTEELAIKQARQADEEIAAGMYRGPLHGIPWGAKDIISVRGYRTTWGATPYENQVLDDNATIYERLTAAGAVLLAKLATGAIAQGDRWFGGRTRNPWNPEQGSSGSSAGPGSATAAGLVGFAIGTETRGSIISPSSRNGVTGLRPTFGLVPRSGIMALSWTMDKAGPMCRSAEDCALVLNEIYGPDGRDNAMIDVPFGFDANSDIRQLRVGYVRDDYFVDEDEEQQGSTQSENNRERRAANDAALNAMLAIGVDLQPIDLPDLPTRDLNFILSTESAAAFDDLTLSGEINAMNGAERSSRPVTFRRHRFVPAVEYIQANRVRSRMIEEFNEVFDDIDLFVGSDLSLTNLTGHPEICFPHGFRSDGTPLDLRLTGKLFGDEHILRLAHAFQSVTDHHLKHPTL